MSFLLINQEKREKPTEYNMENPIILPNAAFLRDIANRKRSLVRPPFCL